MQPVYGDNASRNTVNLNLSECLISSNSLTVIREGSTGELVIAKEVCVLNIRLQLNLSKKKKTDCVLFLLLTLLVSTISHETLMARAKQIGVSGLSVNGQMSNFTEL